MQRRQRVALPALPLPLAYLLDELLLGVVHNAIEFGRLRCVLGYQRDDVRVQVALAKATEGVWVILVHLQHEVAEELLHS